LNSVWNASVVEVSAFWSRTYLNAALVGLMYGELGGLFPAVEDPHQNVLCFAAKGAT